MANLNLNFHYQQSRALHSVATEILYGGAAGGGKSFLMRGAAVYWCSQIPGLQVYLFRRLSDDLYKNHMEGPGSFPDILGEWEQAKLVKFQGAKNFWEFWNGANIWLCHCQYEKDVNKYLGTEISVLLLDEATMFTPYQYTFLRARCRIGGLKIPEQWKGLFPRIICGTNPGGPGHAYFKTEFVDRAPPFELTRMSPEEGGLLRQFIPARLEDNPTLMENDPNYADRLSALGDPALVKAMREGDWNIVAGGALDDVWTPDLVVPRFPIPAEWKVDRSFDWGSAHPFCVVWWAEANGETVILPNGKEFTPAPRSLIGFYEWYGAKDMHKNEGIRMVSGQVARGILEREEKLQVDGWVDVDIRPGPADSQIYNVTDEESESIAEKMKREGVKWVPADKKPGTRVNGLELLRERINNVKTGEGPGIYFMDCCRACISTLPIIPRDPSKPEDVDTDAIDHPYDAVRYRVLHAAKTQTKKVHISMPS